MSFHLATQRGTNTTEDSTLSPEHDSSSEDEDLEEEETWDDWVSDSMENRACKSLFDEQVFSSVEKSLEHDKSAHGFDLEQTCARLSEYLHIPRW